MNQSESARPSEKLRILYLAPGPQETSIEAKYTQSILLKLRDSGETVFFLPFAKGTRGWLRYFFSLLNQIPRCEVIHLNLTHARTFSGAIAPALILAKFFGKATALYILTPDSELLLNRWPRITGAILRFATLVIAPDDYLCELLRDIGASSINVTPIPEVLLERPKENRQIQPRIIVTDPFALPEGPPLYMQVFAHVKEKYPRTELTFCVDRSESLFRRRALESIEIVGVETVITGGAEDRLPEYLRHDVYLQTPGYDNSHLKLFEALGSGIPVVCSSSGGAPEFVADRVQAHLVESSDHVALAERIFELVEDPAAAVELAEAGHRRALELGNANPVKIWRRIYQALSQKSHRSDWLSESSLEPVHR